MRIMDSAKCHICEKGIIWSIRQVIVNEGSRFIDENHIVRRGIPTRIPLARLLFTNFDSPWGIVCEPELQYLASEGVVVR